MLPNRPSMVQNEASMIRNEASMIRNEASMIRNEASMIQNEASMVQNEASMVRNEASMVRNEASMVQNEASKLQNEASVDVTLSSPEQQHRQECLCTEAACDPQMTQRRQMVWHRHSCLCFGKMKRLRQTKRAAERRPFQINRVTVTGPSSRPPPLCRRPLRTRPSTSVRRPASLPTSPSRWRRRSARRRTWR